MLECDFLSIFSLIILILPRNIFAPYLDTKNKAVHCSHKHTRKYLLSWNLHSTWERRLGEWEVGGK